MPPIVLPPGPKVYKSLAPAIKGCVGAREVKWSKLVNVFTAYWGCTLQAGNGKVFKVIPPAQPGAWPFSRHSFRIYKPADGCLHRRDLDRCRVMFKDKFNWDDKTFVCGPSRSRL
ncbi:hypothetical protein LXA43DRAFT_1063879 [Ganoderma leucocontextum]|nr:hypothetical protein LXA43DRAFT_1063879 [Ganoderma leucocontextum]